MKAIALVHSVRAHIAAVVGAMTLILVMMPHAATSETVMGAYDKCVGEVWAEANVCYQDADGFWQNRLCDLAWSSGMTACARAFIKAVGI